MSKRKDLDRMMDPEGEIDNRPLWLLGKSIDTRLFCEEFLEENPMICINNQFFSVDGLIADENSIKKKIYEKLKPWFAAGLPNKTTNLLDCLRIECYSPPLPVQPDRIHVGNGTYFLNGEFVTDKEFCLNRLSVRYNPDAPAPEKWLEFLNGLLVPEDMLTLQEFIGYCLIPTTKAQKMLFLIGKGGEGKSRIGVVLRSIFGGNMNTGSLFKVEENRFARADLEYSLLMVDDDLKLEALPQTNNIKSIVTAELPMDLEKKGKQSYQGRLYVRFLGFGNGTLQALYDRSVGFFRRQIILTVKDRPEDRVDDPFIEDKMAATDIESVAPIQLRHAPVAGIDGLHIAQSGGVAFGLHRLVVGLAVRQQACRGLPPLCDGEGHCDVGQVAVGVGQPVDVFAQHTGLNVQPDVEHKALRLHRCIGGGVERIDTVAGRAGIHRTSHPESGRHVVGHIAQTDAVLRKWDVEVVLSLSLTGQADGRKGQGDDE